ncbi:hypothetical protein [Oligoflexus tunisiensis]|uniref:hypothetical protein n=1 Tax=Oligoflexus tunisiensis TaxID=708132 RepID=UPI00114D034D|nr:hypothetical protein [Oligoflexus tunisiensis]
METVQPVTKEEIQSVPPLPAPIAEPDSKPADMVMVPEIGSECKAPVTANCLKIPYPVTDISVLQLSPNIIKKYSRSLTPAEHKCPYFNNRIPNWKNISYFPDAILYWDDRGGGSVIYNALPINFIFSAGCEIGEDIKNPYASEMNATTAWDGKSTLKSLGYRLGTGQPVPSNFAADRLKAEKVTMNSQSCSFAARPMIYVFPDGVIYQFVGGSTLNIYPMTQVKGVGCTTPAGMIEAIAAAMPKCGQTTFNNDSTQSKTLKDLGIAPALNNLYPRRYLSQDLLNLIEQNGKPISKEVMNCAFVTRTKIHQFADGIAFVDDLCTNANVYSNEYLKKQKGCTVPELP